MRLNASLLRFGIPLTLVGLTTVVFGHVLLNDFINLDDFMYVTNNPHVLEGLTAANVSWAWTTVVGSLYQPLVWMSLQLDAQVFGNEPWGFHLTNLLFHIANVLLVYFALNSLTHAQWRSAAVAALFAVHPMHVESVAWVTERKDVLVVFFWLLMLLAYSVYASNPGVKMYLIVALAFFCGLLSKAMIVTAPFLLLLLDCWPLRRIYPWHKDSSNPAFRLRWLIVEKLPLLVAALAWSKLTLRSLAFAHPDILNSSADRWLSRLSTSLMAYEWYLEATFLPINLAVIYPIPESTLSATCRSAVILTIVTVALLALARYLPALLIGWLWFLGTLFPIVLLATSGTIAWADRYAYFPHVGLFIATVWGMHALWNRISVPLSWQRLILASVLCCLAVGTWLQVRRWRNSETLFLHTLQVTHNNALAHDALGGYYLTKQMPEQALEHYSRAATIRSSDAGYLAHQGQALMVLGRYDKAIAVLRRNVAMNPLHHYSHFLLGHALAETGDINAADKHLKEFLLLLNFNPAAFINRIDKLSAYELLAGICLRRNELSNAVQYLLHALALAPDSPTSHRLMGIALCRSLRWSEAQEHLVRAKTIQPANPYNRAYLAFVLNRLGKFDAADREYKELLAGFTDWRAKVFEQVKRIAIDDSSDLRQASELAAQVAEAANFKDPAALDLVAHVQAISGDFAKAEETARRALALVTDASLRQTIEARIKKYRLGQAKIPPR